MQKSQRLHPNCFLTIMTLLLALAACTDSSTDQLGSNEEAQSATHRTIETQNYSITIDSSSAQKSFSVSSLDGELVASNVTEDELSSRYPAVFDELAMHEVTSGSSATIFYDDPSMNREIKTNL